MGSLGAAKTRGQNTSSDGGGCIRIYPGQYFDEETGLHYNWHRYYDPETGRYLRADPIYTKRITNTFTRAKMVSSNLYAYVSSNPLNGIDPQGLTDYYKNMPKATPADAINVVNHFLDFYNAVSLSNEAMMKIEALEYEIECNKKESASLCFDVYPRPHNVSVNKGAAMVGAEGNRKCVTIPVLGQKNCCREFK